MTFDELGVHLRIEQQAPGAQAANDAEDLLVADERRAVGPLAGEDFVEVLEELLYARVKDWSAGDLFGLRPLDLLRDSYTGRPAYPAPD